MSFGPLGALRSTHAQAVRRAAWLLPLALALSACGGDESASIAATETSPSSPAPAAAPPPAAPPAAAAPPAVASPPPATAALTISRTAPATYQWDTLGVGKAVHIDSVDRFTSVPGKYKSLAFLQTAIADQFLSAADAVVFETNKDVAILVAYDARVGDQRPAWLAHWNDTGDTLTTSDTSYKLYAKSFAEGMVTLGGNELGFNTYAVVVDDGTGLGNSPPTIEGDPPSSVSANRDYLFLPTAIDADGDRLVFSAENLPAWLTLDPATGRLTGTPTTAAVAAYRDIVLTVSDGEGTAALAAFVITVSQPSKNSPPTISAPTIPAGTQYKPYSLKPVVHDPDGDALTLTIANRPRWATFNTATGQLAGTPGRNDVGTTTNIVIQVSDGSSTTSLAPFAIRVHAAEDGSAPPTNTNSAPQISGNPPTSALAGTPYVFSVTASDPEDDVLTYSIANRPAWASFSNTGRLSGTPSTANAGTYRNILISVTDGVNVATLAPFSIIVGAAADSNVQPSISGTAPTSVNQDQPYSFTPTASDANGDSLTFSISGRPVWAAFESATGRLSGTPGAANAGVHGNIRISVSDGQHTVALPTFAISVVAAPPNQPPTIYGTPPTQVLAASPYSFTPTASDPDGGALTFSIVGRPGWATFDAATGRLHGTPTAAHAGSYNNIVISVSDGQVTTSLAAFSIAVTASPTNRAPLLSGTPPTQVLVGSPYSFTPTASDPEGSTLTFSVANRPAWATFDPTTGRLSGTPAAADVGTFHNIVIGASDDELVTSLAAFGITVVGVATGSATLSWTPPTQNTDGSALRNLAGYRIYWGTAPGNYSHSTTVNNAGLTSYVVSDLTPGRWYFAVSAVNSSNTEGARSAEASKTLQ
jgi:hypothetical protein